MVMKQMVLQQLSVLLCREEGEMKERKRSLGNKMFVRQ
jgi:hypothetical protein